MPRLGDSYVEYPVPVEGNGLKQRLRYQFADPGEWPVDVGVYSEITENERLFELEEKILLAKRFGPVRIAANLVAEIEFYYAGAAAMSGTTTTTTSARDLDLHPSIRPTWEDTPKLHLGVETWMHVEFPDPVPATRGFNLGPLVYAGPVVMFDFRPHLVVDGDLWPRDRYRSHRGARRPVRAGLDPHNRRLRVVAW